MSAAARPHAVRLGAWCRRVPLLRVLLQLMVLTACAAALSAGASGDSSSSGKVYLLNAMYSTESYTVNVAQAIWLGMDAAFYHADYTAAGGREIEIVKPSSSVNSSDIVEVVEAALADYPSLLGVIGPYSDSKLLDVLGSSTLMNTPLMFLAPYTSSSVVRMWNPNVYFTSAEPRLEVMVVVKHIANTLRVRRTAFMYLTDGKYGHKEYADFVSLMEKLVLAAPALYTASHWTSTTVNTTAFDAMADTRPQVIVVWGTPAAQTEAFLKAVLTDPRTSSAYIISSFALQQEVFQVYYDLAMAGRITPVDGQVLSSAAVFPISLSETTHIPMFMEQMSKYMQDTGNVDASLWADEAAAVARYGSSYASASGSSSYADAFLYEHPNVAQLMMTGWIAGTLIMQTLMQPSYITSTAAYQAGLFEQHRYIMGGDYVLGDYGGPCNPIAQFLSAVCFCNQGGHATLMQSLSNASWTIVTDSGVNYTQNSCYSAGTYLSPPLNVVTLEFEEYADMRQTGVDLTYAFSTYVDNLVYRANPVDYDMLTVTEATAQGMLDAMLDNYTTSFVSSTVAANLDVHGYVVPSPIFPRPHLVEQQQNYIYLMPTLEQQTYLLYQKLATVQDVTSIGSRVHVVLRGYEGEEVANITAMLQKSAATFDYDDPTVASVAYNGSIHSSLAAGAINYILGLTPVDVPVVTSFLSSNPKAIVVVPFEDLLLQYSKVIDAFASLPTSVQARFVSFSSLPLWTDTSATAQTQFPILAQFFGVMPDAADHTPGKLLGVFVASFLLKVISTMDGLNSTLLVDNVYLNGVLSVYGVTLGTYSWGCLLSTTGHDCEYINYGAQYIAMLSVQRMLDPSVPQLTPQVTPSMVYSPRPQSGLTAAQRKGLIAGCVTGGLALIAAVALLVYCCRDSRDNAAAPKNQREPVTLIFTDIESSTAMWAALPQLMADAIAAHHRVIRKLIRKYGCYEVKTIGDSFMIACKDAYSAVRLACEIQTRLLAYDWGTTEIESTYREFERDNVDTVEGYVPPTARLSEKEYAALWAGLRVRIGIHTGLADIRYDEVTKGYDYYGDTSNMAARTEAIANGGQVVATETTWWALSNEERDATAHTELGPQRLRGVPFAVEMYQLNPVLGRTHAALRTEIDAILLDDGMSETGSSGAEALLSSAGTMDGAAASAALLVSSMFAPYPPAQRVRELQPLLSKWNVRALPRPRQVSEEDYCTGLINRLAIRVANVMQAKRRPAVNEGSERASRAPSNGPCRVNPLTTFAGPPAYTVEVAPAARESSGTWRRASVEAAVTVAPQRVSPPAMRRVGRASSVGWQDAVRPFSALASPDGSVSTVVVGTRRGSDAVLRSSTVSTASSSGPPLGSGFGFRRRGSQL